ncbi:hypothetical protein ERJ75_001657100 [Trypanosoma vivax]|nr:hypothetical protein ERJ75_001657100 [Trypanosoma vivax]
MRQLESERRLTLRLKEDLFKAEYAAMMEADKRKSLEQQLIALETASGRSRSSGALTSLDALKPDDSESQKTVDINEKRGDSQEQIILTHFKEAHEVTHDSGRHDLVDIERSAKVCSEEGLDEVNGQSDCSTQEELLLEISKKEGFINRLQRQYHEAMCALRESRQKEQETLETKCRLEEELHLLGKS